MNNLANKKCVPCEGDARPLNKEEASGYMDMVTGWVLNEEGKIISKDFEFKNFIEAMAFVNKVADIAESEGHHPDLIISYNKVHIDLSTHAIKGLSENDFILAAKINKI